MSHTFEAEPIKVTERRTVKSLCHVLYSGQVNGEKVWLIVYDSSS